MTPEEQRRALAAQALQAWGAPMVPLAGGIDPASDPVAAQDAMLEAQAAQDAQMAAPPPPPPVSAFVDPATVSSMPDDQPAPPPVDTRQQLAAEAYRTWTSRADGPPAPPSSPASLYRATPPASEPAAAEPAKPRVVEVPEQNITASAPRPAAAGAPARRPTLLDEQSAMAAGSRDEADQARMDADISTDIQAELTTMQGEQQAETAQRMAEAARQQQEQLEEAGRVANERRAVKEAVATDVQQQYKKLNDEAAAVEVADRRSTGQRVLGAIAIALGGLQDQANLAAGLNIGLNVQTHNADRIAGQVQAAVERDLEIQRESLRNKRASADAKLSEYALAVDAIKDVDAQEAAARAALMDKYALGLDAIKSQGLGEQATTAAALAAEKLRGDAAAMRAQAAEQTAAKDEDRLWALQVQRDKERKAAAAAAARGPAPTVAELERRLADGSITAPEMDALNKLRKGALENEKTAREIEAGPAGSAGLEPPKGRAIRNPALAQQATREERAKFNETQNVTQALESKIDRLLRLREEHGVLVGVPQSDAYKEAQTLNREIMLGLKKKEELGTLDNQSERFLNEMTGDPNAWFYNTPETQLNAIKRAAREDLESRAQGLGYSSAFDSTEEYAAKYGAVTR